MGVSGLLPQLKSIQRPASLSEFAGQRLAVDAYAWLHKAALSCPWELANGVPTTKYMSSIIKRINLLRHYNIEPFFVFDGDYLPAKAATESERARARAAAKEKAAELVRTGASQKAHQFLSKAVDITPEMAKTVIEELRVLKVAYVVAPYEADPQMVWLEARGIVSGIISEDSDLLVFGATNLITKLTEFGDCLHISRSDFPLNSTNSYLATFGADQLRALAILSGCDYTPGIPGIGVITACRIVHSTGDIRRAVAAIRRQGRYAVPADFEDQLCRAELSFLYQRVWDVQAEKLTTLHPLPPPEEWPPFLDSCIGCALDSETARRIAVGELHPISKRELEVRAVPAGSGRRPESGVYGNSVFRRPPRADRTASNPLPAVPIDRYFSRAENGKTGDSRAGKVVNVAQRNVAQLTPRKDITALLQSRNRFLASPSGAVKPQAGSFARSEFFSRKSDVKVEAADVRGLEESNETQAEEEGEEEGKVLTEDDKLIETKRSIPEEQDHILESPTTQLQLSNRSNSESSAQILILSPPEKLRTPNRINTEPALDSGSSPLSEFTPSQKRRRKTLIAAGNPVEPTSEPEMAATSDGFINDDDAYAASFGAPPPVPRGWTANVTEECDGSDGSDEIPLDSGDSPHRRLPSSPEVPTVAVREWKSRFVFTAASATQPCTPRAGLRVPLTPQTGRKMETPKSGNSEKRGSLGRCLDRPDRSGRQSRRRDNTEKENVEPISVYPSPASALPSVQRGNLDRFIFRG